MHSPGEKEEEKDEATNQKMRHKTRPAMYRALWQGAASAVVRVRTRQRISRYESRISASLSGLHSYSASSPKSPMPLALYCSRFLPGKTSRSTSSSYPCTLHEMTSIPGKSLRAASRDVIASPGYIIRPKSRVPRRPTNQRKRTSLYRCCSSYRPIAQLASTFRCISKNRRFPRITDEVSRRKGPGRSSKDRSAVSS
jgi:hypothetical protein